MSLLMVWIWPEFEPLVQDIQELLEHPLYEAILGEASVELGITSFEGLISLELFILSDFIFIALIVQFGAMSIAGEANSGTLDLIMSYPIPRWRFLLEKLLAAITLMLAYPLFMWGVTTAGASALNIEFNNQAFLMALLAKWTLYTTLTCIAILCSVIFMDSTKTLGSAGLILGGSFMLERLGGLIRPASETIADLLQGISLFHYLDGVAVMNAVMNDEVFPLNELGLVVTIGIVALVAALVLFRKREFTR